MLNSMAEFTITRLLRFPPDQLADILAEAEAAGFRFVRRLVEEWEGGRNRFDRPGEALFAARSGDRLVGVCGLNADPYALAPGVGRVRRLYVRSDFRRRGVGRRLVQAVVAAARGHYRLLRLRAGGEAAARFFEALGFRACAAASDCTHTLHLPG